MSVDPRFSSPSRAAIAATRRDLSADDPAETPVRRSDRYHENQTLSREERMAQIADEIAALNTQMNFHADEANRLEAHGPMENWMEIFGHRIKVAELALEITLHSLKLRAFEQNLGPRDGNTMTARQILKEKYEAEIECKTAVRDLYRDRAAFFRRADETINEKVDRMIRRYHDTDPAQRDKTSFDRAVDELTASQLRCRQFAEDDSVEAGRLDLEIHEITPRLARNNASITALAARRHSVLSADGAGIR